MNLYTIFLMFVIFMLIVSTAGEVQGEDAIYPIILAVGSIFHSMYLVCKLAIDQYNTEEFVKRLEAK